MKKQHELLFIDLSRWRRLGGAKGAPYRGEHLRLVKAAYEREELLMAGALADPVDQAILVFRIPDKTAIEKFIREEPYARHGLIKQWTIRLWMVVVGDK
jgi:uncharacterized protein YciI